MTGAPFGYGVIYGDQAQHKCLVLDRAKAEETAARLHGTWVPLFAVTDEGVDPEPPGVFASGILPR